jgi:hypothetical protein
MMVCSVPLILTTELVKVLIKRFTPKVGFKNLWGFLNSYGLIIEASGEGYLLNKEIRSHLLNTLEGGKTDVAREIHKTVLDYLRDDPIKLLDKNHFQLWLAYHTTPFNPDEGAKQYALCYYEARLSNNFAVLPVIAKLTKSQEHWLTMHLAEVKLFNASALYYEGSDSSRMKSSDIFGEILKSNDSTLINLDVSFLLGTITENKNKDESIRLYEQAINCKDNLDFSSLDPIVQNHLFLILAKSYFNVASILQAKGDPGSLDKADEYYRHGIQITSNMESVYETAPLQELIKNLYRQGKKDEAKGHESRITQVEQPFRQAFLVSALNEFRRNNQIGDLYYSISSLNHGYGYNQQALHFDIQQDGAVNIVGNYEILSTSFLPKTDFYLDTTPETKAGVHFGKLESLTPNYNLEKEIMDVHEGLERLQMTIDPPLKPGDKLTYRWTAHSDPGTVATTRQELDANNLKYEYIFWDIIVPMKRLLIQATLPIELTKPPASVWVELWRITRFHVPLYRTSLDSLDEDTGGIKCSVDQDGPDKVNIKMEIKNPWLSVRYVLAWLPS